jgi:hypothetical protein
MYSSTQNTRYNPEELMVLAQPTKQFATPRGYATRRR